MMPRPTHLLLVEADPLQAAAARYALEERGYRVTACAGPAAALAHCATTLFDLALTNAFYPDESGQFSISGGTFAGRLLAEHLLPSIVLTGWPIAQLYAREDFYTGQAFLAKPYTTAQLRRAIREVLRE